MIGKYYSIGTKLLCAIGGGVIVFGFLKIFTFSTNEDSMDLKKENFVAAQPYIPENLQFAGENVPMQFIDVKESLDRELLVNVYWHSQTILLIKRANRFFPIIEPILKEYGIPEDFKYIPVIESGLTNVGSPAGAKGYWQIVEGTAKGFGLEINENIDERNDIEKSTRMACKYFLNSFEKFKSWPLVAASYNMGISGLSNSISNQGANNFYELWLNTETARYVYRIIAAKLVIEHPKQYGIDIQAKDLYCPIKTIDFVVDTPVGTVASLACKLDISYKTLKTLNPWLVSTEFPNKSRKKYIIKVPETGYKEMFSKNE